MRCGPAERNTDAGNARGEPWTAVRVRHPGMTDCLAERIRAYADT